MKRTIIAAALSLAAAFPAIATESPITYGIGTIKCAAWTRGDTPEIIQFIFGYYSGLNFAAVIEKGRQVGGRFETTPEKVALDVAKYCDAHPNDKLATATVSAWLASAKNGE